MCFMDILKGYENWQNKLGKKYLNSKIESSEELFECLGLFINDCNNNDKNLDQPRYSWWQDFCEEKPLQNTVVLTHAGVIKHLLARVLNLAIPGTDHMASIEVPYGCLIKISLYRDESGKVWSKLML